MTLSRLVFRSMRKNLKDYYLYFFALIFSVTLCFSYTTLQYNPQVIEALENSGTASAGFKAATYVLYYIVMVFVLYASHLFMKRRSKEIGLYQLIGMTKGLVIRLIIIENLILFVLAVSVGMIIGFLSSRFFAMILMKVLEIDMIVTLSFSNEALQQSVMIFSIILIIILVQIALMIRRVSLLSLFTATKKADERVKRFSTIQMLVGLLGLGLVIYGYFESTLLFNVEKERFFNNLYLHMLVILGSTIVGTFLFFRYSVALMMNLVRSKKRGYLDVKDVLAVTPIMHRMKGNAKSLTLITTLTGLAVGIMTLSYISYYSSETNARQSSPYDYILLNNQGLEFIDALDKNGIEFEKDTYQIASVVLNIRDLVVEDLQDSPLFREETETPVISISEFQQLHSEIHLSGSDAFLTSYVNLLSRILPLQGDRDIVVKSETQDIPIHISEIREDYLLSSAVTMGSPLLVVSDELFEQILNINKEPLNLYSQVGINLVNKTDLEKAQEFYTDLADERTINLDEKGEQTFLQASYEEQRKNTIASFGLTIFVTAYLGLAFLLTTGSILYFKQIAEAEEEKEYYTILRKVGFSTSNIMKGIYAKQAFNFGVPLIIGLLHSYFAVRSGWWLFGTEMVTPLVIIMCLYVTLYAIFALLAIQYNNKVVKDSL